MAACNMNIKEQNTRSLEKSLWQEYLTMPSIRELDCPIHKTFAVPLKEAGKGRFLEEMWEEHRAKRAVGKKKVLDIENFAVLESKAAFVNATTLKSQMARLNRHVQLGLRVAESDLDQKRNKLKGLILKEETDLTREYVDRAQKLAEELLIQKKKKVDEIIRKQEQEREELANLRREQQARDNSETYRIHVSKLLKLEAAEVQKQQICEKMLQNEREEEFEKFWLDLESKRDDERKKYEEQEAIVRLTKLQEQREILNKQLIGKEIMQNEMKKIQEAENIFIDKLNKRMKEEEEKEKEFIYQQKLELKKIKLAQLEENQKLRMERVAEEKAFDDYYCKKVAEGIANEKVNEREMKAQNKREADYFRQQLKDINEAKLEEERKIEALRKEEVAKKEAVIRTNRKVMRIEKEKLHRETLETWKQQIIHKKQVLESEKELEKLTDQWSQIMLNKNIELDKMLEDHKKDEEIKRVKDLNLQLEYTNILNERQIQEDDDFLKMQQTDQQHKDEEWKSFKSCPGYIHPFTDVLLKKEI